MFLLHNIFKGQFSKNEYSLQILVFYAKSDTLAEIFSKSGQIPRFPFSGKPRCFLLWKNSRYLNF